MTEQVRDIYSTSHMAFLVASKKEGIRAIVICEDAVSWQACLKSLATVFSGLRTGCPESHGPDMNLAFKFMQEDARKDEPKGFGYIGFPSAVYATDLFKVASRECPAARLSVYEVNPDDCFVPFRLLKPLTCNPS